MYDHIFFDLDGTLTDPGQGITNSVAYALEKFGIIVEDRRELYCFIGPPLVDSFMEFYGLTREQSADAVKYYRERFRSKGIFENEVYPGTEAMLKALREAGKKVILATSKPEEFAKIILEYFGLDTYFDFVAGATMDDTRSKKADVISYALEANNIIDKKKVLMVGDRKHDIIGAKENGIDSVGVLFGYGSREELEAAGADYIAAEPIEIVTISCR